MITLAMLAWLQNGAYVRFLHTICTFINNFISLINVAKHGGSNEPISESLDIRKQKLHVRSQLAQRQVFSYGPVCLC